MEWSWKTFQNHSDDATDTKTDADSKGFRIHNKIRMLLVLLCQKVFFHSTVTVMVFLLVKLQEFICFEFCRPLEFFLDVRQLNSQRFEYILAVEIISYKLEMEGNCCFSQVAIHILVF